MDLEEDFDDDFDEDLKRNEIDKDLSISIENVD